VTKILVSLVLSIISNISRISWRFEKIDLPTTPHFWSLRTLNFVTRFKCSVITLEALFKREIGCQFLKKGRSSFRHQSEKNNCFSKFSSNSLDFFGGNLLKPWHLVMLPLDIVSDWWNQISYAVQPIRRTTQIWVGTPHHYGICALLSQTSFGGETSGSVATCHLFSQATTRKMWPSTEF